MQLTKRNHQMLKSFLRYKSIHSDKADEYSIACVATEFKLQRNTVRKIVYDIRVRDREFGEWLSPSQIKRNKLKEKVWGRFMELNKINIQENVMWRVLAEEHGLSTSTVRSWIIKMREENQKLKNVQLKIEL